MTREELLAQARWCDEAREEIADWAGYASEYFQEKHDLVDVLAKWQVRARELRAQAEAMNNGAARQVEQSPGEVAPITGTAGSIPAAAPPSVALPRIVREGRDFDVKFHDNGAAQPLESVKSTEPAITADAPVAAAPPFAAQPTACLCCGTQTSGVAIQHAECAEAVICASCVEVLRAAPDLAARVRELEALLRCVHPGANGPECCDIEGTNWFDARDAALAKGE